MTRKFLENKGLSKEIIDEILDENSKDIGKAKTEVDAVKAELETAKKDNEGLKSQIAETETKLANLQKSNDDVETLKQEIKNLQTSNQEQSEKHNAEMKQLKIDVAVETALSSAKAKNIKAAKALLELENAELQEDGTVKGLDEQIKKLAFSEDTKFMFNSGAKKMKGAAIGESGDDDDIKGADTENMTYSQMVKYLANNPDAKI